MSTDLLQNDAGLNCFSERPSWPGGGRTMQNRSGRNIANEGFARQILSFGERGIDFGVDRR